MDNKTQTSVTQPQPETQMPVQAPEPTTSSSNAMWYVIGFIGVLVLIGGVYFLMRKSHTAMQPTTITVQVTPTLQPKPTMPRSKALGIVTNVSTAPSLDPQGNAVTPSSTFSATTKTIYLVVSINNAKIGTKIEYVRYLNGKYLDNNSLKVVKANATNTSFVWALSKDGATHLVGNYRVKVYSNGVFEKETSYSVQ